MTYIFYTQQNCYITS